MTTTEKCDRDTTQFSRILATFGSSIGRGMAFLLHMIPQFLGEYLERGNGSLVASPATPALEAAASYTISPDEIPFASREPIPSPACRRPSRHPLPA